MAYFGWMGSARSRAGVVSVAFVVAVGAVMAAEPAQACSGVFCDPGEVFPFEGKVPSNALAWFVRASRCFLCSPDAGVLEDQVTFARVGGGDAGGEAGELALSEEALEKQFSSDAEFRYTPVEAPDPGTVLRVERWDACDGRTVVGEVQVTEPAPIPQTLGTTRVEMVSAPLNLTVFSGSCTDAIDCSYADVTVELTPEAQPFADVLRYRLLVDGSPHASDDWPEPDIWPVFGLASGLRGRGVERVYTVCNFSNPDVLHLGVSEGPHVVQFVALLPDDTVLESDAVEIELSCPPCEGPSCSRADGGVEPSLPAEAGAAGGSAVIDAAIPGARNPDAANGPASGPAPLEPVDAGAIDSVRDAGSHAPAPTNRVAASTSGCSCVLGPTPVGSRGVGWALAGLLGLCLRRGARRTRCAELRSVSE